MILNQRCLRPQPYLVCQSLRNCDVDYGGCIVAMCLDSSFLRIDMPGRAQPEANILSIQVMIGSYVEIA